MAATHAPPQGLDRELLSWLNQAQFRLTVARLAQLPPEANGEVAFVGRSNAGKSSALNLIVNRKQLAFSSKQAGRTQALNFFALPGEQFLVDLPGYGFARASRTTTERWDVLIGDYLRERASLKGVVLIMDARHPLTQLDRHFFDWHVASGKPVHVLLAKADKLSRSEAANTLRQVNKALAEIDGSGASAQLFSSLTRQGVEQAREVIANWLGYEATSTSNLPRRREEGGSKPKTPGR